MFENIESLPHTGDLQTKAFQGHYLKQKEIIFITIFQIFSFLVTNSYDFF